MRTYFLSAFIVAFLLVSGCASTTPIKDLGLPPVSTIEGTCSGQVFSDTKIGGFAAISRS
jgi:hypothetical protein